MRRSALSKYLSKRLENLQPYTPGEQPQDQQYIKLNTNENPYPPSPWVAEALNADAVDRLRLYSDPACKKLREAVATRYGISPAQIMAGNGSDENLFFALRAFCDETKPLACADVTYGCYAVWANLMHIPTHIIPLEADYTLDPKKYYDLGETIVIANPNAPTGLALAPAELGKIADANAGDVVIVDEAYVDFGAESCVPLLAKHKNLLVVQTFSKSRSLAGARLGIAMGSEELIADLNRVKNSLNPYNVNSLTLLAGATAMRDEEYFRRCCAAVIDTREKTAAALRARNFTVLPGKGNFLFARTDAAAGGTLYRLLKAKGVLVRHFDAPRTADWLRITIGTPAQMQKLLGALDDILPAVAAGAAAPADT
jgi:histidinol-phosphate aminotransferase